MKGFEAKGKDNRDPAKKNGNRMGKLVKRAAAIGFWLLMWQVLAMAVHNAILVVSPWETLIRLTALFQDKTFFIAVGMSLLRIGAGFLAGFLTGMALATASSRFPLLENLLGPLMSLLKAVPVASFVVLLLIWWGSSFLAVAICFLVVLPNIYINTLEGLKSTDRELLEMAKVFRLPTATRFFYIYRPALQPFLISGLKLALGMCWKSGIAAEVIGTPVPSIGGQMYLSKIYLDTAGVFAWTAVIIVISVLFERLFLFLTDLFFAWQPACRACKAIAEVQSAVVLENVCKSYELPKEGRYQKILENVSNVYEPGMIYYLTSPSGSGKTTLLKLLSGLTKPDSGNLSIPDTVSMVFQEDRLCMDYSALKNVEMITGDPERAEKALKRLLEAEDLGKPCSHLSGGMKRRVALVRAMEARSQLVLLDEPFTGMDVGTMTKAEAYIRERQQGRTVIIATHI